MQLLYEIFKRVYDILLNPLYMYSDILIIYNTMSPLILSTNINNGEITHFRVKQTNYQVAEMNYTNLVTVQ